MKRIIAGTGLAGFMVCLGVVSTFDSAEAACRRMLADRSWQYVTVCDNYRGGSNYSGALSAGVAAAGIAAELLPGILENLGDVSSGVGDITSNVAPNFNNPLENFLSGTNQHGSQNDGTLNPFNIFNQQPETPAAKKKNAKNEEAPSLFPNIFAPQPTVNVPDVNTPQPTVNVPQVNTPQPTVNVPIIPNIFAPTVSAPQVRTPTPQVRTPTVQAYDPSVPGR
jgi:hypothetical protein